MEQQLTHTTIAQLAGDARDALTSHHRQEWYMDDLASLTSLSEVSPTFAAWLGGFTAYPHATQIAVIRFIHESDPELAHVFGLALAAWAVGLDAADTWPHAPSADEMAMAEEQQLLLRRLRPAA